MGHLMITTTDNPRRPDAQPLFFARPLDEGTLIWYSPKLGAEGAVITPMPIQGQELLFREQKPYSGLSWPKLWELRSNLDLGRTFRGDPI
jgi:hypothetical protein